MLLTTTISQNKVFVDISNPGISSTIQNYAGVMFFSSSINRLIFHPFHYSVCFRFCKIQTTRIFMFFLYYLYLNLFIYLFIFLYIYIYLYNRLLLFKKNDSCQLAGYLSISYRPCLEKGSDCLDSYRQMVFCIQCHNQLIRTLSKGRPVSCYKATYLFIYLSI